MVDDDRYCIDVLTQISGVTRALQEVTLGLLDDHVRHSVHHAVRTSLTEGEAWLDELTSPCAARCVSGCPRASGLTVHLGKQPSGCRWPVGPRIPARR